MSQVDRVWIIVPLVPPSGNHYKKPVRRGPYLGWYLSAEAKAFKDAVAERARQINEEQWTAKHDDEHQDGELVAAALCYAANDLIFVRRTYAQGVSFDDPWPWEDRWDKRPHNGNVILPNSTLKTKDRIRQLEKAGALIAAEIDRLLRL